MKHLAAFLLLGLAGNSSPSASDINDVLSSVGIDADSERVEKLLAELEGKDIQEVRYSLPSPIVFMCANIGWEHRLIEARCNS